MATKKPSPRKTRTRAPAVKRRVPTKAPARRTAAKKAKPTAARAAAGAPQPARRRAIFIDVENTSSEESLMEVLEGLKIDRAAQPTELTAVGNWRAAAQRLARHLASLGAQLVHSAPAPGVKDWSDLWIAVAAGCWLGQSTPGDILEIVSNDRAFDAVGDAAAARGVIYQRLQHRRGAAAVPVHASESKPAAARRSRGGRRRRYGRPPGQPLAVATTPAPAPPRALATAPAAHRQADEPHGATREQMLALIGRLTNGEAARWVNLDVLEKALKDEGFARPAGSPRLVTRLRMLKEVEVDSHGRARIAPGARASAPAADHQSPHSHRTVVEPDEPSAPAAETAAPAKRRRRRRKPSGPQPEAAPIE